MPNKYVSKAERGRIKEMDTSRSTLLDLCNNANATPEVRLEAVKLLGSINQLEQQVHTKEEDLLHRDKDLGRLRKELEDKTN